MRFPLVFFFSLPICLVAAKGDQLPEGYKLVYKQDFEDVNSLKDFIATDIRAWKWGKDDDRGYIEQFGRSKYKYKVRSPYNIALVGNIETQDFVLFADLQQTGKEYGHRDMCVFYNFQNRSRFYYTHIASVTDKHAHNCFIVNEKPRTKISHETSNGHKWSSKPWHNVKVVRQQESGKIEIYVNDMSKPIMRATDKTFGMGRIGFGSFDDTGRISKVRLYSPEAKVSTAGDPFGDGRQ